MVSKYPKFLILLLPIFGSSFLFAQQGDTLEKVKMLNKNSQYKESLRLLNDYRHKHKKDIYGGWLYAHTLHLTGQFTKSQQEYYTLETKHPYNYDIKLDRINKVIENGHINKAIQQLKKIEPQLPKDYNFMAHESLAQLYYWKGDYDTAFKEIEKALYLYYDHQTALVLKEKIVQARSNWANVSLGFFNDDQPLSIIAPDVDAGFYLNSMTTIGARLSYPVYSFSTKTYTTPWLSVSSKFNFIESKIGVKIGVGIIAYQSKEKALTGLLQVKKQLSKYSSLSAGIELAPYLATTFTIPSKLMQTQYGVDFDYNNPKGFIGKASYSINQFPSMDNSYFTVSCWVVSPPLKLTNFELRGGYGINYSDAKKNNFTSINSLENILANWDSTYTIDGTYNPFFSPNNQMIHSVVSMVKYSINKDLDIGVDINYGFSAKLDVPYLFLDKANNGETTISRNFKRSSYNPLDINTYINYKLPNNIHLKAFYKFQRASYYESNYIGISSRFTF